MDGQLYERIFEKLTEDASLDDATRELVDAACNGADELAIRLEAPAGSRRDAKQRPAAAGPAPGVSVRSLEVRSFRGIGPMVELELEPGPGLTLVVGRNGSGKSSFAEALEMLMTGDCRRWSDRKTVDWKSGWRNIHATDRTFIRAKFGVEGASEVVVKRTWDIDELAGSTLEVSRGGESVATLAALGWDVGLAAYRPFLSYAELGTLIEEPHLLYDQLEGILGLQDVAAARTRLADARKTRDRDKKAARDQLKQLLPELESLDDPRAAACATALSGRRWDLDTVEGVLTGDTNVEAVADIATLQRLSQLSGPAPDKIADAVSSLQQAQAAERALATSSVEQADALAKLLRQALMSRDPDADTCPICEQLLPHGWADRTQQRLEQAANHAESLRAAKQASAQALGALRSSIQPVPRELTRLADLGLSEDVLEIWRQWAEAPAEPDQLVAHVEELVLRLDESVARLRAEATSRREAQFDAWQPVAARLATWTALARKVEHAADHLKRLKKAEDWMGDAEEELRNERFEPIAERAQEIWEMLRRESSVSLTKVELEKAGRRRKVKLNVAVEGTDSVALAVMSQGELNALALSLFLPRMTLPDTPFRFVMIDDPVQAMDPTKVDGLARVLASVAQTRQVIVFTHDTRLPEAVRRLDIPARVIEVARRPGSVVEAVRTDDPIARHIEDARALTYDEDKLGPAVTARVVPSFCRSAIEAGCVAAIRRRRIGRGQRHEDVAEAIKDARSTNDLVALTLFDDEERGGDVLAKLNNLLDHAATDAYKAIREGAHGAWTGRYRDLVREADRIARRLEALR